LIADGIAPEIAGIPSMVFFKKDLLNINDF
jgi:hypothetical protein